MVIQMKNTFTPQFKQTAPDRLEMKKGGGCIGCFGVPFFIAGLFILLIGLKIIPVSNANEVPWWSWLVFVFMGLAFTSVGSGMVFGRNWITLDMTRRRIWVAWGLLKPMRGQEYNLDDYEEITLKFIAGDSDTADSYPVSLKDVSGNNELAIFSTGNYGTSFEQATLLSNFINLPLKDLTTDHPITVKTEETSIDQDTILTDIESDIPSQPFTMKCDVQKGENYVKIRIPGPAFSSFSLIGLLIPIGFFIFFGYPILSFFESTHTPHYVQYFFIGFVCIFFFLFPFLNLIKSYILSKSFTMIVTADTQGICIEQLGLIHKKPVNLTPDQIIGLDYGTRESIQSLTLRNIQSSDHSNNMNRGGVSSPAKGLSPWITWLGKYSYSKGIIIKSTNGMYSFGAGLPDDEIYYLYILIKQNCNCKSKSTNKE